MVNLIRRWIFRLIFLSPLAAVGYVIVRGSIEWVHYKANPPFDFFSAMSLLLDAIAVIGLVFYLLYNGKRITEGFQYLWSLAEWHRW